VGFQSAHADGTMIYMKIRMILGCIIFSVAAASAAAAERVYLHPDEFINRTFANSAPPAQALWVAPELRQELQNQFGWRPGMRVRYWQDGERTAWILDEIGKDKPITAGVVVARGEIETVEVLVFRESRGWEIQLPRFTAQFVSARLTPDQHLTQSIDGITGATLSVKAMKRMARVALRLHDQTPTESAQQILSRAD